jgi:hypothetical protein
LGTDLKPEHSCPHLPEKKALLSDVERRAISEFVQHVVQMTNDMEVLDLGSDRFEAAGRAFYIAAERLGV